MKSLFQMFEVVHYDPMGRFIGYTVSGQKHLLFALPSYYRDLPSYNLIM